jgi:MoaA/NifB/PqqE/SkfB family radical SAM enzyme
MIYFLRVLKSVFRLKHSIAYFRKLKDFANYTSCQNAPPLRLQIELVSICNYRCKFCYLGQYKRAKKILSLENVKKILNESQAKYIQLSGIGESFLHPEIKKIMAYAKKGGRVVKITTNGFLMTEDICRAIIDSQIDIIDLSIDTTNPELYKDIRLGGNLNRVLGNVETLATYRNKKKSKLIIRAVFVYSGKNISYLVNDIENVSNMPFFDEISLGLVEKLISKSESHNELSADEILNYITEAAIKARSIGRTDFIKALNIFKAPLLASEKQSALPAKKLCYSPLYSPYVMIDGTLLACCASAMWALENPPQSAALKMGNVLEQDFSSVWNSSKSISVRQAVINKRECTPFCKHCKYDENIIFKFINKFSRLFVLR